MNIIDAMYQNWIRIRKEKEKEWQTKGYVFSPLIVATVEIVSPMGIKKIKDFFNSHKPLKIVKVDLHWNDFYNKYIIYKTRNYYVVRIKEEYFALGSPSANAIGEEKDKKYYIRIYPKNWTSKIICNKHWEEGIRMCFEILDIDDNWVHYVLKLSPPKDRWYKWEMQEYHDFGWKYDDSQYDGMWFKYK